MASIIKQLNKKTGVTYVYESESYWDKEKRQPRSRRRLIGKIDDETGEIIPTGKSGRKKMERTDIPETVPVDGNLEALCLEQQEQLRQDAIEIAALKKQVMELTLSVNEYKRRLSKIAELAQA